MTHTHTHCCCCCCVHAFSWFALLRIMLLFHFFFICYKSVPLLVWYNFIYRRSHNKTLNRNQQWSYTSFFAWSGHSISIVVLLYISNELCSIRSQIIFWFNEMRDFCVLCQQISQQLRVASQHGNSFGHCFCCYSLCGSIPYSNTHTRTQNTRIAEKPKHKLVIDLNCFGTRANIIPPIPIYYKYNLWFVNITSILLASFVRTISVYNATYSPAMAILVLSHFSCVASFSHSYYLPYCCRSPWLLSLFNHNVPYQKSVYSHLNSFSVHVQFIKID